MIARGLLPMQRIDELLENKLEREYAQHLELLRRGGEILRWWPKMIRVRIGSERSRKTGKVHGVWYTTDFLVQLPGGELELHETKGHMRPDARVRLNACVEATPFPVKLIRKTKGKGLNVWDIQDM